MRITICLVLSVLIFASCQKQVAKNPSADAKRFPFKGKVVSVNAAGKKATIDHEDIPGYMEGMTMEFPIREDSVWEVLKPGSDLRAELVVDNAKGEFWLENISISAAPNANQGVPATNENFVQIGKEVPNFDLINQDGNHISLKDFHGKAIALTFIYRECPLPDYCIKMSQNFSDLANRLNADPDMKNKVRLLSISFDPARDTPEKLKQYGLGYLGGGARYLGVWELAVGTDEQIRSIANFFGLDYRVDENNKAVINHSLRTAVIGPDGKVTKIFPGNEWTPDDLLREIKSALSK